MMEAPILKLTNNPCKYCNIDTFTSEPICGDLDEGATASMGQDEDGFCIEYWWNFGVVYSTKINFCPMCGRKLTEAK